MIKTKSFIINYTCIISIITLHYIIMIRTKISIINSTCIINCTCIVYLRCPYNQKKEQTSCMTEIFVVTSCCIIITICSIDSITSN